MLRTFLAAFALALAEAATAQPPAAVPPWVVPAGGPLLESAYLPLQPGTRWVYAAGAHEIVQVVGAVATVEGAPAVVVETRVAGRAFQTEHLGVLPAGPARLAAEGKALKPPLLLLKEPGAEGDTWKIATATPNGPVVGELRRGGEKEVAVPAGKYRAVEVSGTLTVHGRPLAVSAHYARGVGLVKQTVGTEVALELKEFVPPPRQQLVAPGLAAGLYRLGRFAGSADTPVAVVRLELQDGQPTATVVGGPVRGAVGGLAIDGEAIRFTIGPADGGTTFEGRAGKVVSAPIFGSVAVEGKLYPARLVPTERTDTPAPAVQRVEPMSLFWGHFPARKAAHDALAAAREPDEKARLEKAAAKAEEEFRAASLPLLEQTLTRHADSPLFFDALDWWASLRPVEPSPEQAREHLDQADKAAQPYGPRWQGEVRLRALERLAVAADYAELVAELARAGAARDGVSPADRVRWLKTLQKAVGHRGTEAERKKVAEELKEAERKATR